jgi:beta-galactosidase
MKKNIFILFLFLSFLSISLSQNPVHTFKIGDNNFLLDGKPFQIISGEIHFARIPMEAWRDRLKMVKAMGLNTICTYIFWNYHEPEKGKYNFTGNADVAEFVKIAQEEGLWVIIRPSPYACAEWEFGGYPYWLLKEKDLKVRSKDPGFIDLSKKYFKELGNQLAPLQVTKGGSIIMVQLENEYGSYDKDKEYLTINKSTIRESGFDVELYTCDGPGQMADGYLSGVLPAVNGFDQIQGVKELVNKHYNNKGPYFIAEWYPAWFDDWGSEHNMIPAENFLERLDSILANGFSLNMYMVHGGTTRGFMNGANYNKNMPYTPQVSSYDYDAPINEAGNATPKFIAFRNIIKKYLPKGTLLPEIPAKKKAIKIDPFKLKDITDIYHNLPEPVKSKKILSMEEVNQAYGYILYRTKFKGPVNGILKIEELRDYASIYANGRSIATLDRRLKKDKINLVLPPENITLDIFVENLGRINYGPFLNDNRKGITEKVSLDGKEIENWEIYSFPFKDLTNIKYNQKDEIVTPIIRKSDFNLDGLGDLYLDMRDWGKGCVWVNGYNIGRYWNIGPQQTLYVPAEWLKKGKNEIIVFEQLFPWADEIKTLDYPILDDLCNHIVTFKGRYDKVKEACVINLSCKDPKSTIYYTTNGSEPLKESPIYKDELVLKEPAKIIARGFKKGIFSDTTILEVHPSLSSGKGITIKDLYSQKYTAGGKEALVDGIRGSMIFKDGLWQGYEGVDFEAVIDLGEKKNINRINSRFYHDINSWIFMPKSVEYFISEDGFKYERVFTEKNDEQLKNDNPFIKYFPALFRVSKTRYVKISAKNINICPGWHKGAGGKAWMFIDEITVE